MPPIFEAAKAYNGLMMNSKVNGKFRVGDAVRAVVVDDDGSTWSFAGLVRSLVPGAIYWVETVEGWELLARESEMELTA